MKLHLLPKELGDAATQIIDEVDGFAIRHVEDAVNSYLRWQAGKVVDVPLNYRGAGMTGRIQQTVAFYRLFGFGKSLDEAVQNAKRNPFYRKGREQ